MPTVLYHSNSSPPSRAVKMVAGILGVKLEERYLNPVARDQDTPELIEKNPMKSIPLLDEGDYWLADRLRSVMAPTFWGKLTELSNSMKSNIEDAYRTLEAYLSHTLYVADEALTLADISIVTTVSTIDGVYPVDVKRYPKLKQWLHRMSQKDFCQKYNEPGREELVTVLVTMMENNRHNQKAKL